MQLNINNRINTVKFKLTVWIYCYIWYFSNQIASQLWDGYESSSSEFLSLVWFVSHTSLFCSLHGTAKPLFPQCGVRSLVPYLTKWHHHYQGYFFFLPETKTQCAEITCQYLDWCGHPNIVWGIIFEIRNQIKISCKKTFGPSRAYLQIHGWITQHCRHSSRRRII